MHSEAAKLKAICEAGCPKSNPKILQSVWYMSIMQKGEDVGGRTVQFSQRGQQGRWAGQVASTSSKRRYLNHKSLRKLVHCAHVLSVKAMDDGVKKSDDDSSKNWSLVLQVGVPSLQRTRGPFPHAKPEQVNSLHPDPRMLSSRRKNEWVGLSGPEYRSRCTRGTTLPPVSDSKKVRRAHKW
ncbi:hypothetical protein EDD16DRAFT_1517243 [Pisolithus croceorrhizus]|nr:hypothetical protein EDD16DRAFT_1517243 [Pisolithus croceorrhizus]